MHLLTISLLAAVLLALPAGAQPVDDDALFGEWLVERFVEAAHVDSDSLFPDMPYLLMPTRAEFRPDGVLILEAIVAEHWGYSTAREELSFSIVGDELRVALGDTSSAQLRLERDPSQPGTISLHLLDGGGEFVLRRLDAR